MHAIRLAVAALILMPSLASAQAFVWYQQLQRSPSDLKLLSGRTQNAPTALCAGEGGRFRDHNRG